MATKKFVPFGKEKAATKGKKGKPAPFGKKGMSDEMPFKGGGAVKGKKGC